MTPQERRNELLRRFGLEDDRQMAEDIRNVMAIPAGRRLFMALCYHGGLFKFTQRDDNHAYVAGKRDAVLELFKAVKNREPKAATLAQIERDEVCTTRNKMLDELNENHEQEK